MRGPESQTRFVVRASLLLIGMLTLWWFVMLGPMLYLLQGAAGAFIQIEESPSGDWTLRVPLEATLPPTPQQPLARQLRSIDFDMPRSDAITFTFSLPVYWAIMLAASGVKRHLRPLLWGTAVMAVVELILLLAFAQITARDGAAQMAAAEDPGGSWMRHVGVYLTVSVLPYIAPFAVALSFNGELRAEILPPQRSHAKNQY